MQHAHTVLREAAANRLRRRPWTRSVTFLILLLSLASLFGSDLENSTPRKAGPIYVPLDSWVYPALNRLAAMGYVPDEEGLAAPWTRSQCLVLIEEAEDIASRHSTKVSEGATNNEAQKLILELKREFA